MSASDVVISRVPRAMQVMRSAMHNDPGYAWAWHCNVAMASVDEGMEHKAANRAAARFMYAAFGVDIESFPEYQRIQRQRTYWRQLLDRVVGRGAAT